MANTAYGSGAFRATLSAFTRRQGCAPVALKGNALDIATSVRLAANASSCGVYFLCGSPCFCSGSALMASGSFGRYSVASILGMVLGALVGAGAESALQADRELRRQAFLRSQEAHNLWIEGRVEGDNQKINMARFQIAAYGSKDQVMAVRNWMEYEDEQSKIEIANNVGKESRRFVPIDTCPSKSHPEMKYYMAARHSTKAPNFSLFTLLTSISFSENLPDEVIAEVALRCFLRTSSD